MNITKSISGVFQIDVPRSRNGEFLAWDAQWLGGGAASMAFPFSMFNIAHLAAERNVFFIVFN